MKKKRILSLLTAVSLIISTLTGCSIKNKNEKQYTLRKLKSEFTLIDSEGIERNFGGLYSKKGREYFVVTDTSSNDGTSFIFNEKGKYVMSGNVDKKYYEDKILDSISTTTTYNESGVVTADGLNYRITPNSDDDKNKIGAFNSQDFILLTEGYENEKWAQVLTYNTNNNSLEECYVYTEYLDKVSDVDLLKSTYEYKVSESISQVLDSMTLKEKIYQTIVTTPEQISGENVITNAGSDVKSALKKHPVGGLIFFEENVESTNQFKNMVSSIQKYSDIQLFTMLDEEGGKVSRLGKKGLIDNVGAMANVTSTKEAKNIGNILGSELATFGINVDLAPVADFVSNQDNTVIGTRAFGYYEQDVDFTSDLVSSAVSGFKETGTLCTLKHFPGHGNTATDSHTGLPVSAATKADMEKQDWKPFKAGIDAGADFVMVGHIAYPEITGDNTPASMSEVLITDILKEELGFDGYGDIVMTDALNMGAITSIYSPKEAAVSAINAGCDIILMPSNLEETVNGIMEAVTDGTIDIEIIDGNVTQILLVKMQSLSKSR